MFRLINLDLFVVDPFRNVLLGLKSELTCLTGNILEGMWLWKLIFEKPLTLFCGLILGMCLKLLVSLLYFVIVNNLSFARIYVLLNGFRFGYFSCSQGVRQRDSLSLILFGIAEEFLSRLICIRWKLVRLVLCKLLDFPTHFLYAVDILLFCRK